MSKKKILVVSSAFYPQSLPRAYRTTELVKEFARQGYSVTLITRKNKTIHEAFEKKYGVTIKDLGKPIFKEINYRSSNKIVSLYKRFIRRILLWLFEYPDIGLMFQVKKALKNESGYDLLISVAVPHPVHWGTAWAWDEKNPIAKTWVADSGDPYVGVPYDNYKKPIYFHCLEKSWGRKCTFMAITHITMNKNYFPEFRNKIVEIPQGFNFESTEISKDESTNKVPTFAFAGTYIKSVRDPTIFLTYLSTLKRDFKFITFTRGQNLAEPFKAILGDKLILKDFIPRNELITELSKMDFLVNFGYDPAVIAPSKLVDYYITKKPVLSFKDNSIDPQLINEFLDGNYTRKFQFENMDKFRIENVTKQFLDLVKI